MATIFETVQDILVDKYSKPKESITPESTLESLGLDSLDLIELMFEVEDAFNIRVPQEAGTALKAATVQDIVDNIQKMIEQGEATTPVGGSLPS
jgi:acyl carrier protein